MLKNLHVMATVPLDIGEAVDVLEALLMYIDHQRKLGNEACDAQDFDKARNHRDVIQKTLEVMTRINENFGIPNPERGI